MFWMMRKSAGVHDFRVGVGVSCPLIAASFLYLLLTLHRPHRPFLIGLTAAGVILAAAVMLSPVRRWIERGNIDAHMIWWCGSFVTLAAALSLLDGGLSSPFVAVFFVSVAFAATALPLPGVIIVSSLNVVAVVAIGLYEGLSLRHDVNAVVLWSAGLIATALVGATVSRDRAGRSAELRHSREEVVHRLARVVEFRDTDTGGHVERMSHYSRLIAEALGWSPDQCHELELAAALHDVGKVAVPDAILLKPGRLTSPEREQMQCHCQAGFDMLTGSGSDLLDLAATIALTHHERYDGLGYPAGLRGEQIPLPGRIVAVADVFDALTSERVYKQAMSTADALAIIRQGRGAQFDATIVDAFLCQLNAVDALHAQSVSSSATCPMHATSSSKRSEPAAI